ncbi:hypothetical protein C7212DRAFT_164963 [Tuber magnatum]|uniref:Myb-like domain-containing protein n=1 Tax=Tuber magnatum TaxID=42249 RepID=A0A317T1E9_9PEZI|nr:hypothetical protein C7212DRAFT_164963 [Tuber magnatum]
MEEESAQALLALNKGVAAADGEGRKKKQRKKGKKKKDKKSEEVVRDEDALEEEGAPGDVAVAGGGDDLPDSQRIISQHLAAHMSKIAPAPASAGATLHEDDELLMMETELGYTAVTSPPPLDADDVLSSSAFHASPPRKKGGAVYEGKKNKRTDPIEDANRLVDPALMEFDEATAAAAAAANISVGMLRDGIEEPKKRKRRLPTEKLDEGPEKKKKSHKKKVSEEIVDSAATNLVQPSSLAPLQQLLVHASPTSAPGPIPTIATATPSGGSAGGTFSVEEKQAIDVHLARYAEDNSLAHADLCRRVWANERRKDDFWEGVCSVLPQRSRASIYKHVRRQYHVFTSRAKWTESEDEHLAVLVKEKGSAWKAVGDAMGRMGEDCRDRWRNYGKCGKDRGKDRWDESEESELKKIITEVLTGIRARRGITDPFDLDANTIDYEGENEINWTVISDLMGNKRSRIQCRYKWNKMKQQKARSGGVAVAKSPSTWKKKKAKAFVEDMLVGDHIWLLKQIRDSGAKTEKTIPWENIVLNDKIWYSRSAKELERAYKKLRQTVPHKRLPLPEIVNKVLKDLEDLSEDVKGQRYLPDPDGTPTADGQQSVAEDELSQSSAAPLIPDQFDASNYTYEQQPMIQNVAPVASMSIADGEYDPNHAAEDMALVDPELIGQGIEHGVQQDLEKTAGEAIMIAAAAAARERERSGEDETERELRRRLGVEVLNFKKKKKGGNRRGLRFPIVFFLLFFFPILSFVFPFYSYRYRCGGLFRKFRPVKGWE